MNEEMEKIVRENAVLRDRCFVMSKGFLCDYCNFKCEHKVKGDKDGKQE